MRDYGIGFSEEKAKGFFPRLKQIMREPITKTYVVVWMTIVPAVTVSALILYFL